MKRIVLISCVSKKGTIKAKAKDLYKGPLFRNSLAYGQSLKPDKIYILSALYHLLELDNEIEPYNVTLSYISPKQREKSPDLKILSKAERKQWGEKVLEQLSEIADLRNDKFIILAGQSYMAPIRDGLVNIEEPLKGLKQGERVKFLAEQLR